MCDNRDLGIEVDKNKEEGMRTMRRLRGWSYHPTMWKITEPIAKTEDDLDQMIVGMWWR